MNAVEKHYSVKELEELLNISRSTIDRLVKAGKLQRVKFGRSTRFTASNVNAYLQEQTAGKEKGD